MPSGKVVRRNAAGWILVLLLLVGVASEPALREPG